MATRLGTMPGARSPLTILALASMVYLASGHGFLSQPVSRNWRNRINGKEYCPHCLNGGTKTNVQSNQPGGLWQYPETVASSVRAGLCGDAAGGSQPHMLGGSLDNSGTIEATYTQGQDFFVEAVLATHHRGHFELFLCDISDGGELTAACLQAQPLYRAEDNTARMGIDEDYPGRYYLEPKCAGDHEYPFPGTDYTHLQPGQKVRAKYQLPTNVTCSHCVLQWWWITGNSCTAPGYNKEGLFPDEYSDCSGDGPGLGWKSTGLRECGSDSGAYPEEFWNCADIQILPGDQTTAGPTTGGAETPTSASSTTTSSASSTTTSSAPLDECALGTHNCAENAVCTDTASGFTCSCNEGFIGDGVTCSAVSAYSCFIGQCGCPGEFLKTWCTVENHIIDSAWCNENADNCASCNGAYCAMATTVGTGSTATTGTTAATSDTTSASNGFGNTAAPSAPTTTKTTSASGASTAATTTRAAVSGYLVTSTVGTSEVRRRQFLDTLGTYETVTYNGETDTVIAIHSSGGAAGGVVTEGQGYGLLIGGVVAASMDSSDSHWTDVVNDTYYTFKGWRQMNRLSASNGNCQSTFYCGDSCPPTGGSSSQGCYPCLSHWKVADDMSSVIGTGSASDGDIDAVTGMILLVVATQERAADFPWWDNVARATYQTCKQLLADDTVVGTGSNEGKRILKLGSCWGGFSPQGNNPSYHAPGAFRAMRDFMATYDSQYGTSASEGDGLKSDWDTLTTTTYEMLSDNQCPGNGLTTNWFQPGTPVGAGGGSTSFSGSGTPGPEFGSEASRGVWRVVLDALWYPGAVSADNFDHRDYLERIAPIVADRYNGNACPACWDNVLDNLGDHPDCFVTSIHSSWNWNAFMFGPVFSSLVPRVYTLSAAAQQTALDAAGTTLSATSISDYYSGSWVAIATLTLNGDLAKAGERLASLRNPGLVITTTATTTTSASSPTTKQTVSSTTAAPSPPASSSTTMRASTTTSTTTTTSTSHAVTTAPPPAQDAGICNIGGCGCFPFNKGWCTAAIALVQSAWCQESSSNCGNCNGAWCPSSGNRRRDARSATPQQTVREDVTPRRGDAVWYCRKPGADGKRTFTRRKCSLDCLDEQFVESICCPRGSGPTCDVSEALARSHCSHLRRPTCRLPRQ